MAEQYSPDSKEKLSDSDIASTQDGEVNTSGHIQELDRNFKVWSICALSVVMDNAWASGGGSLVVALYNGGGPGVLYGLIAATIFYAFMAASLAELASAMPSSANVYHWASVCAGPRYGKAASFFAGWWNFLAWTFGTASPSLFAAEAIIALYALYNPDYVPERWQIFIAYLGVVLLASAGVMFGQRYISIVSTIAGFLCVATLVATFLIVVVMTAYNGTGYASNYSVWQDYENLTGWDSAGFVFLAGMLNGAYAIGTVDGACHLCEEVPRPRVNVPWAMVAQLSTGFLTTFVYFVVLLYGISSFDDIVNTNIVSLPLAAIYQQATNSTAATAALLVLFIVDLVLCLSGPYIVAGRMLWTLARDDAVPGASIFRSVNIHFRNPLNAQIVITIWIVILGAIYVGNATAFNAFVGVFVILTTMSYACCIIPHMLTGRKNVPRGPFWMPAWLAYPVMGIACAYIIVFDVIYMFPFVYPVDKDSMNYSCVLVGGITLLLIPWYLWKRHHGYVGPEVALDARDDIVKGVAGLTMQEEELRRHRRVAALRHT